MKKYRLEKLKNGKNPIFNFVDDLYVLILENSPNEKIVREQLSKYNLCKNMYLQWNKGYKYNNYPDTTTDLKNAFLNILKINKNKKNVMILEEDFIIKSYITKYVNEIEDFIIENNPEMFLFGSILWETDKPDGNFVKVYKKLGVHSSLINNIGINKILNNDCYDIDTLTNKYIRKYSFCKPLIIQVYNNTDNQNNWCKSIKIYGREKIATIYIKILQMIGLSNKNNIDLAYYINYTVFFSNNSLKDYINFTSSLTDLIT